MTYIIVGLGNPGEEYLNTRHNTGRIVLEFVKNGTDADFPDWKEDVKNKALVAMGKLGGKKALLLLPNSFMNNSGNSLRYLIIPKRVRLNNQKAQLAAEELVVIHDDLDLPIGKYRISFNRGPGGHNGVKSIIKAVKTEAFLRVRVGISPLTPTGKLKKPMGDKEVQKHILGEFKKPELETLKKISKDIAKALVCLMTEGREKAMSLYN